MRLVRSKLTLPPRTAPRHCRQVLSSPPVLFSPWTSAGAPDPDYRDHERITHHTLLTDPFLLTCFRRRFPDQGAAGYDEMIRLLGYVWDCPHDAAANVTGHRCAVCDRRRAAATGQSSLSSSPASSLHSMLGGSSAGNARN
jgi:hypothetical protein